MTATNKTPEPSGQVSDAVRGNWVDHLAPAESRPYLRLSRADRPIGTWLLLLPCLWGVLLAANATGWRLFDLWIIVGCAAGAWLMRGAGCTWNDITDRDIDARVARTRSRPIPSGQVTVKQAMIWLGAQALVSFGILMTFNWNAVVLGILSLALVAIYPFAKRFTWWPQVFLGLAFNWGALLAWTAHTGALSLAPVLLYFGGIAWTIFYDTIYAHQDKEDDALIGVKSTARLFGDDTHQILRLFLILTMILLTAAVVAAMIDGAGLISMAIGVAGVWAMGWHMSWQLRRLNTNDPDTCLFLFRANRDTGLIPALFLAVALLV
ncbi:4-hydroxybenzoate octaprenyltransferase [Actibacterium sp. XHP0104]|uniref:4-hydroxybenzoate octaprenyltransferase n=1 Tax=Actibacterium sp. XHP0104 TaxID=2984335 RepID=UPI0021E78B0E|nr:4-hydroxybenzoate octaprenyltransferase [Actibacterium sp. XHP0104]MCV2883010.1 4-hydroxybenzoate octaprenyltransferase [Actibacterium sp. XHP0104]